MTITKNKFEHKYQEELLHIVAKKAMKGHGDDGSKNYYHRMFVFAKNLSDDALEKYCQKLDIDYLPYLNTGEDK